MDSKLYKNSISNYKLKENQMYSISNYKLKENQMYCISCNQVIIKTNLVRHDKSRKHQENIDNFVERMKKHH